MFAATSNSKCAPGTAGVEQTHPGQRPEQHSTRRCSNVKFAAGGGRGITALGINLPGDGNVSNNIVGDITDSERIYIR